MPLGPYEGPLGAFPFIVVPILLSITLIAFILAISGGFVEAGGFVNGIDPEKSYMQHLKKLIKEKMLLYMLWIVWICAIVFFLLQPLGKAIASFVVSSFEHDVVVFVSNLQGL